VSQNVVFRNEIFFFTAYYLYYVTCRTDFEMDEEAIVMSYVGELSISISILLNIFLMIINQACVVFFNSIS